MSLQIHRLYNKPSIIFRPYHTWHTSLFKMAYKLQNNAFGTLMAVLARKSKNKLRITVTLDKLYCLNLIILLDLMIVSRLLFSKLVVEKLGN